MIRLHQVDAGEELVCGVDALQVLAGDVHEFGQSRAGADEHRLKAHLLLQLVDGDAASHDHVGLDLHAQLLEGVHLLLHDGLGQAELGDAVHQHAPRQVQGLEDRHVIALFGQVAGAGQPRRARADHRHLMAVGGRALRLPGGVGVVPVGHKPLQAADAHRLVLDAADALGLALALLGADAAAHGGQGAVPGDDLVRPLEIPLRHLGDELGDMDFHRAPGHAGHVPAIEAPGGLVHGLLPGVAKGHFAEVARPHLGVLVGHGVLIGSHVGHVTAPPV